MGARGYRAPMSRVRRRNGVTLPELIVVLAASAVVAALGVRALHHHLDRIGTRAAVSEAALAIARARDAALAQHTIVAVRIDTTAGTIAVTARGDRIAFHALRHAHGVRLTTTRDSIAFDVRGLGYGAANLTLVARRGAAVDSLVVSRLGRTRF